MHLKYSLLGNEIHSENDCSKKAIANFLKEKYFHIQSPQDERMHIEEYLIYLQTGST